jgi:hypothetical protein
VIWIVPGFSVAGYARRPRALHDRIEAPGPFAATAVRFIIEARKPSQAARAPRRAG